ncbi:MAG: hypothetical protein PHQ86_07665, partial [Dehalococcoidales bacterium]|nr:hypothetical protein [Dehalococcoidales bacterium]
MYSADTVTSLAFIGAPYNYNDICLIYPLSTGKVLALQEKYGIYLQILTMDRSFMIRTLKEKGVEVNASDIPQPFDYLIQSADYDSNFLLELERAFRTFIKEEVRILSKTRQIVV